MTSPLRTEAEAQLAAKPAAVASVDSATALLHELQVHQIELEMQNEALRQAQIALEESRDRYADLFEFAPVGYLTLAESGLITEANFTAASLLGVERKRLLNNRLDFFVAEYDRARWQQHFVHVMARDERQSMELALAVGDGLPKYARFDVLRRQGTDGRASLRVALIDINERKTSEALRASEQRFKLALAGSQVALFEQDTALRYTWIYNPKLGYAAEQVIGKRDADIMDPAYVAALDAIKRRVIESGQASRQEVATAAPGGPVEYYDLYVEPRRDVTGRIAGIRCAATDITRRQQVQFELEQANTQLAARTLQAEEASAAKTRFLSSVSHELRTPLHTILGFVHLSLAETQGEVRRQLSIVERSGAQLLRLIDDLLEFNQCTSFVDELQVEAIAFREFLSQLEDASQLMAGAAGNLLDIDFAADLPAAVWVDEQRLLQVLENLIGNACKYTPNGKVSLAVKRELSPPPAEKHCRLSFTVTDTGIGIAQEDQERIFEIFNRGSIPLGFPGLGLGLAIARQWVEAMGGSLQVQSALGQGSRFFFSLDLPLADTLPQAPLVACTAYSEALAASPRIVLIADDIFENRLYLRDLCEHLGYGVVEADDGDTALSACLAAAPPISAVLVDQYMPRMDGWELLRQLRLTPALAPLPLALISASMAERPADFPAGMNFDYYLGKPLDEQALACFLCRHLDLVAQKPDYCPYPVHTPEVPPLLPAADVADFRQMLKLGMVVRMEAWAEALAARDSRYADFADRVVQHCRAADLPALSKLAAAMV